MIHDGYVKGAPLVQYPDTKTNIEAIAAPVAGMLAYASDTGAMGRYDGVAAAWVWGSAGDDHNDLAGLQGGVASEYYHLTSTQHTAVAAMVTAGLDALTAAEVDQLENIGAVTISNAQWGYLGAADQGIATGDSPTFADVFVPDGGAFGIAGNELLTVNAAGTFAFSGIAGVSVEDGDWIGNSAATARLGFDSSGAVDYGYFLDCFVSVGRVAPVGHFDVYGAAVDTTATYYGIYSHHAKTGGATDTNDYLYGIYSLIDLNQAGGTIGHFWGGEVTARLTTGNIGDAGNTRTAYDLSFKLDLDGGKVWGNALGANFAVDQEAANEVTGDIYGQRVYVDADGTVGGSVILQYLDEGSNVDWCLYQNGTASSYLGGHLGIGTSDIENWAADWRVIHLRERSFWAETDTEYMFLGLNAYRDAVGWKYRAADEATLYMQSPAGEHSFLVTAAGAADAAITWTTAMTIDKVGNVGIKTATFGTNAVGVLALGNGTQPTTSPADIIQLFSMDIAGGAASLGIRTEEVVTAGAPTPSHKVKIKWNGTEYWLSLDAV